MYKFFTWAILFVLLFTQTIFADQIILKNGDKLTGKIVKKDGDSIVIQTEFAGLVTIAWSAVEKIIADDSVNLTLTDGQMLKGKVATEDNKINVETETVGTVKVEKDKIQTVRSDAEQIKFESAQERLRNPRLSDLWSGSADVGYALTTGNSSTSTLTASGKAARETTRDKISVYANLLQARNKTTGISVTSANAIWAGIRYDINLNRKTFAFISADFEYDKPQQLDLRTVFGGGLGYRAIRNDRTQFDLFAGATLNREYFSTGLRRNSAEILIGDELKHKLNSRTILTQRLVIYPNVSRIGEFRSVFDASIVTGLNKWLGWHVTIGDRYNSFPVVGAKKNDFFLSTGLRATFGRRD